MHLKSTDLDLKGLSRRPDHRRVERLVHIGLGHCDIVLEPAGDRLVHLVDHAQTCIAVLDAVHDDSDRKEIIYLVQGLALVHHLLVNAEKVFNASGHLALNAGFRNILRDIPGDLANVFLPLGFALRDLFDQVIIDIGFEILE